MRRRPAASDRRVLIWMVASAAGVQAFFQAGDAFLSASLARTLLWLVAMVVTFILAAVIEKYKDARGG
jgi:membrane protein YdbS with pleckstrin-like domain